MQPLLKTKGIQEQESMRKNYSPTANMGQDKDMRTEDTRLNAQMNQGKENKDIPRTRKLNLKITDMK